MSAAVRTLLSTTSPHFIIVFLAVISLAAIAALFFLRFTVLLPGFALALVHHRGDRKEESLAHGRERIPSLQQSVDTQTADRLSQ